HRLNYHPAGVIYQYIDSSEAVECLPNHLLYFISAADIGGNSKRLNSKVLDRTRYRANPLGRLLSDDYVSPLSRQTYRNAASDTLPRPRHDSHSVPQRFGPVYSRLLI